MTNKPYVNKTRRKALLNDLGYTEDEMDAFWEDAKEFNMKVKVISSTGRTWRDLTESQIASVPNLRRIHENNIAEQKQKEEESAKELEKELEKLSAEKELKDTEFEQWSLEAIENNTELSENDIRDMLDAFEIEDYREYGENRRWLRTVSSILKIKGRYFQVNWQQGLTETQYNSYMDRPFEVIKHEYQKTITVTEWIEK
jgi:monoamine oxidase